MTTLAVRPNPGQGGTPGQLNIDGNIYTADADGNFNVPTAVAVRLAGLGTVSVVAATTTANRPTDAFPGMGIFDLTIGRPVWRNAANTAWLDPLAPAADVAPHSTTLLRPATPVLGQRDFDTDLGKPIWWNGTAWVLADGTAA